MSPRPHPATQPFFSLCRDPNTGHSTVPANWDPYTLEDDNYLEINKQMDSNSMKLHLRTNYLQFWTQTYQALPTVAGEGASLVPPEDSSEASPVPPADNSGAPTEPSAGDSEVAQMPVVIGF